MKHFIYKNLIPKAIKKQIENKDYREFLELPPEERKKRLKVNNLLYFTIVNYCYIYSLLYILFDVEKFSGWAGAPPKK